MSDIDEMAEALIAYRKEVDSCPYKADNPEICVLIGNRIWHTCHLRTKEETSKCPLRMLRELGGE